MAVEKITEQEVAEKMNNSAYVLIVDTDNTGKKVFRHVPKDLFKNFLDVNKLEETAALIPIGKGDSYAIGFQKSIPASVINTSGEIDAVDNEYAYCAYYEGLSAFVGETLYISGACSRTAPLYVFKDADGIVIDIGWGTDEEALTVVENYKVNVPENAELIYVNQLKGNDFAPCVVGFFPKVVIGEDNFSEDVAIKMRNSAQRNEISNALKGTATGSVVAFNDVSPVEHEVDCVVRSKNLIAYPYVTTTKEVNGITWTDNGDGSITVNGTATAAHSFALSSSTATGEPLKLIKGKTYIISNNSENVQLGIQAITGSGLKMVRILYNATKTFVAEYEDYYVYLYVSNGKVFENEVVYPQIEEGTEATEWVPYVDPASVKVNKHGKNLSLYSNITSSGTAAWKNSNFLRYLQAGTYTFSCKFKQPGTLTAVAINVKDASGISVIPSVTSSNESGTLSLTFSVPESGRYRFGFYSNYSSVQLESDCICEFTNIQIECGDTLTDFEEPVEAVEYEVAEGGTVEGVTSLAPNMTLMTDTANTYVDIEYNRDINKAFEELTQAIISLGGNV